MSYYNYGYSLASSSASQQFSEKTSDFKSPVRTKSRQSNMLSTGSSIVKDKTYDIHPKPDPYKSSQNSYYYSKDKLLDSSNKQSRLDILKPSSIDDRPLVGIHNIGNTCYMNAVLQNVARLPCIKRVLKQLEATSPNRNSRNKGKLLQIFTESVKNINTTTSTSVYPHGMRTAIGSVFPQFMGYQQHDCAEFFHKLLEALNEELNRVNNKPFYEEMKGNGNERLSSVADRWWNYSLSRENSFITDFFLGQYLSTISCLCGHKEVSCDTFFDITLTIPNSFSYSVNLIDCFDAFVKEFQVNEYRCQGCKNIGNCAGKNEFYRLPKVLTIQLKRFVINSFGREEKLGVEISFPENLDLKKYCRTEGSRFKLHGVCHHTGTLNYGHYYAECNEDGK